MYLVLIINFRLPGQRILMLVVVEEKKGGHSKIAVYCCFIFISQTPTSKYLHLKPSNIRVGMHICS